MVWAYNNPRFLATCDFYVMGDPTNDSFLEDPISHVAAIVKLNSPLHRLLTSCFECCGLLCIHVSCFGGHVVCNPMINEFDVLPQPPSDIGFGLVPSTNDFKVVRIAAAG